MRKPEIIRKASWPAFVSELPQLLFFDLAKPRRHKAAVVNCSCGLQKPSKSAKKRAKKASSFLGSSPQHSPFTPYTGYYWVSIGPTFFVIFRWHPMGCITVNMSPLGDELASWLLRLWSLCTFSATIWRPLLCCWFWVGRIQSAWVHNPFQYNTKQSPETMV